MSWADSSLVIDDINLADDVGEHDVVSAQFPVGARTGDGGSHGRAEGQHQLWSYGQGGTVSSIANRVNIQAGQGQLIGLIITVMA